MSYYNLQSSERLRFRQLTQADIPLWMPFFENNDSLPYLGIDLSKPKEAQAEAWIGYQLARYERGDFGHLAAELKSTGEFIGMGGIVTRDLEGQQEYEIAYSLLPSFWGRGFATEIATHLKVYGMAHLDCERLISIIHIDNHASKKVAKKNGMTVQFKTKYFDMDVEVFGIEQKA